MSSLFGILALRVKHTFEALECSSRTQSIPVAVPCEFQLEPQTSYEKNIKPLHKLFSVMAAGIDRAVG